MAIERLARQIALAAPILLAILLVGCGGGARQGGGIPEEMAQLEALDITADAYLFDARFRQNGKLTSLRLELYYTDTLVGIGGRGYLGKGALKGRLTEDSLLVYFPSTNEYAFEAVKHLLESEQCPGTEVNVPLAGLFSTTPDSLLLSDDLIVESDYGDADNPEFIIRTAECPWRIEIDYDRRDGRWQVKDFSFDSGGDVTLVAERRTIKLATEVSGRRFAVAVPPDALRLEP